MVIHKSHTEVRGGKNQAPKDTISELPINLRIYRKAFGHAVSESGYMIGTDIILGIDCAGSNFWNSITSEYKVEKYRPAHMEEYHMEEKSLDFNPNLMKLGL
jgi:enolase